MHDNLSRVMGILALKTLFINIENWEIDENSLKNKDLRIMFLSISRNTYNIFEDEFLQLAVFLYKIKFN